MLFTEDLARAHQASRTTHTFSLPSGESKRERDEERRKRKKCLKEEESAVVVGIITRRKKELARGGREKNVARKEREGKGRSATKTW